MGLETAIQNALAATIRGPVVCDFDTADTNVRIIPNGGVTPNFEENVAEDERDLLGIYDLLTQGNGATVEMQVPEISLSTLGVIFPQGATDASSYRGFGWTAGKSMRDDAVNLRIRPYQTRDASTTQIEYWLVVPMGTPTFAMTKDATHFFTVQFRALPDATKPDGQLICKISAAARGA